MEKEIVISVKDLNISFRTNQGLLHAVRGVSFDLFKGETLAIVGESGSGKSVTSKTIMGILANNAIIDSGSVIYENQDLTKIPEEEFHKIRGNKIGMIFQDPTSALNPIMRVGKQIVEALILNGQRRKNKVVDSYINAYNKYNATKIQLDNLVKDKELPKNEKQEQIKVLKNQIVELKKEYQNAKKLGKRQVKKEYEGYLITYKNDVKDLIKRKKEADLEYKRKKAEIKDDKVQLKELENELPLPKLIKEYLELREKHNRLIRVTHKEAFEEAIKIMKEVGIPEPERRFKMYPFQFSGGMKQRVVIAIALMAQPQILICDEPTTALDVTIQAQILQLIKQIKRDRNLSVVFITHNLGVVANVADRIAVMYAGKIVEYGTANEVFYNPRHPYTWALMSSMPDMNSKEKLQTIPGTPPNMLFPPKGDAFAVRNRYALKIDYEEHPPLFKVSDTHYAATWLLDPRSPEIPIPEEIKTRIAFMKTEVEKLRGISHE
ncbi:MAG: ATP-binding cassette domain-containing protein [Bacillales bacterium]|jgi:oligopeptide transport system ATP-binding protein|nr:ATP-binding cassette domain-containing protein [Bacillales bacterium]